MRVLRYLLIAVVAVLILTYIVSLSALRGSPGPPGVVSHLIVASPTTTQKKKMKNIVASPSAVPFVSDESDPVLRHLEEMASSYDEKANLISLNLARVLKVWFVCWCATFAVVCSRASL